MYLLCMMSHTRNFCLTKIYKIYLHLQRNSKWPLLTFSHSFRNIKLLHCHGFAPRLYATFNNGLAYEFVPGRTLSVDTIRLPNVWRLVARQLARLHKLAEHAGNGCGAELWPKMQKYFDLVPDMYDDIDKQRR